jgi:hypothetical protein
MPLRLTSIVIDCQDPETLAGFWAEAIGYTRAGVFNQYAVLENPDKKGPNLLLQRVPEPRSGKNRVHWDWLAENVADQQAEVKRLEGLGAAKVSEYQEMGIQWVVMNDPEGNVFCIAAH